MTDQLPRWLFVSYGGGHVKALLPVARRVKELGLARPLYLALTTAAPEVVRSGIEAIGFRDLLRDTDLCARAHGERLASELKVTAAQHDESVAYLGLSYADLEARLGVSEAAVQYGQYGRQAFLPLDALERALNIFQPELVVATNSPRAEQAAIQVARKMGIPAVCLVDLLGIWEQETLVQADYANALCVINSNVQRRLIVAGRRAAEVHVTGNPAFDSINTPEVMNRGKDLRTEMNHDGLHLCLYASSPEPPHIPGISGSGDVQFPRQIEIALIEAVIRNPQLALWIRRHPSEPAAVLPDMAQGRIRISTMEMPLHACLHASDEVIVSNSTVGVEASLAGKPVLQIRGSILDHLAPYLEMGIAYKALPHTQIAAEYVRPLQSRLDEQRAWRAQSATRFGAGQGDAAGRVAEVLREVAANHA